MPIFNQHAPPQHGTKGTAGRSVARIHDVSEAQLSGTYPWAAVQRTDSTNIPRGDGSAGFGELDDLCRLKVRTRQRRVAMADALILKPTEGPDQDPDLHRAICGDRNTATKGRLSISERRLP
jgi:hypothetical protein